MNWSGKRVLVTGAGGFIGSHLAEALVRRGAEVRALIRYTSSGYRGWLEDSDTANDIEFVRGDIRDSSTVQRAARDRAVIFHLAALIGIPYSYEAPDAYVRTNALGTLNVLTAATNCERVIHTSTSEVYGTAITAPIAETHPLQGQSPYSATKIAADKLAESFYCSFQLPVVTVRPFNTYGPRQSTRAVIPAIITQILSGTEIRLGSLTPTRDLNFVEDTVAGFIAAAEGPETALGKVFNLGSGREISIGGLVELLGDILQRAVIPVQDTERLRPGRSEVQRLLADSTLAQEILGWAPRFTLEEGLRRTVAWFRDPANLQRYRAGEYSR